MVSSPLRSNKWFLEQDMMGTRGGLITLKTLGSGVIAFLPGSWKGHERCGFRQTQWNTKSSD